jgi:hypothetical protein
MGFMDKAKKLAEQAQQKLDETQKSFNKSESQPQGDGVKYDEHGRPIQDAPPAGAAVPPTAEPAADAPAAPPPPPAGGDADSSPDPFKPIQ